MKWILYFAATVSISTVDAQQIIEWRKDKVTQIIFPAEIVKYRAGYTSEDALTQSDGRVLYIQPVMPLLETNLNIVTSDGNYYAFDLVYNDTGTIVNYIVQPSMAFFHDLVGSEGLLPLSMSESVSVTSQEQIPVEEMSLESLFSRVKKQGGYIVANNIIKLQKLNFLLQGVYANTKYVFFWFRIENASNVPFDIDYIAFSIMARKTRKTSSQERLQILPVGSDKEVHRVDARSAQEVIYCFDKFTIGKDKTFMAELLEEGGDRNISLRIPENFIIGARKL